MAGGGVTAAQLWTVRNGAEFVGVCKSWEILQLLPFWGRLTTFESVGGNCHLGMPKKVLQIGLLANL